MNEIVIFPNGTRQITGDLAHKFAFGKDADWQLFLKEIKSAPQFFFVIEPEEEGFGFWIRAAQSSIKGAYSYLNPDRILVYFHNSKDESHLNALQLRLSDEREHLGNDKNESSRVLRRVWIAQIEKEIASEREFLGMPPDQALPEMTDAELLSALNA